MPRKIIGPPPPSAQVQRLLGALAQELQKPKEYGQPLILEKVMEKTGAVHVTVFWDEWESCSPERRYDVILDAFERVQGKAYRDRILLALPVTVPEAFHLGLLPFRVLPVFRATDPFSPEDCRKAMIAEGASILESPVAPLLCFAEREDAEACVQRLQQRLPGPHWSILHEPCYS